MVTVEFGSKLGSSLSVVDDTTLKVTSPDGTAGPVDVKVTTAGGSATLTDGYTFVEPPPEPTISAVDPNSGTTAGGTEVTITGTGFKEGA